MKVFKTILWTSLFWILVIAGLWVASIFYPQEAKTVIHQNVKNAIIENANIECAIANWEQEPVKIEEEVAPVEEITPVEEEEIESQKTKKIKPLNLHFDIDSTKILHEFLSLQKTMKHYNILMK